MKSHNNFSISTLLLSVQDVDCSIQSYSVSICKSTFNTLVYVQNRLNFLLVAKPCIHLYFMHSDYSYRSSALIFMCSEGKDIFLSKQFISVNAIQKRISIRHFHKPILDIRASFCVRYEYNLCCTQWADALLALYFMLSYGPFTNDTFPRNKFIIRD